MNVHVQSLIVNSASVSHLHPWQRYTRNSNLPVRTRPGSGPRFQVRTRPPAGPTKNRTFREFPTHLGVPSPSRRPRRLRLLWRRSRSHRPQRPRRLHRPIRPRRLRPLRICRNGLLASSLAGAGYGLIIALKLPLPVRAQLPPLPPPPTSIKPREPQRPTRAYTPAPAPTFKLGVLARLRLRFRRPVLFVFRTRQPHGPPFTRPPGPK